jgi:dihydrofolate synthase/folylpolyglutamate synthase
MAFKHFANNQVDIAVIEVGLGGRLDSTNIIRPLLSIITNIGFDHSHLLGDTLGLIAGEKAGIIKDGIPVVIGERNTETDPVFINKAQHSRAPLHFAQDHFQVAVKSTSPLMVDVQQKGQTTWKGLEVQLGGPYQHKNLITVLQALDIMREIGYPTNREDIQQGLKQVIDLTGIRGRWQVLGSNPKIICDTGHNRSAMEFLMAELQRINRNRLHMVLGFVNDKDIGGMLAIMPKDADYYFCAANLPRSLDAQSLASLAYKYKLHGTVIPDPNQALQAARDAASPDDLIFVGGSTFVVAELKELDEQT